MADSYAGLKPDRTADGRWKPSIHMPRSASRITLEVVNVRAEYLNQISHDDAIEEGIEPLFSMAETNAMPELSSGIYNWKNYLWHGNPQAPKNTRWRHQYSGYKDPIGSYSSLWELINGPGSWEANPDVWVVEFKVI